MGNRNNVDCSKSDSGSGSGTRSDPRNSAGVRHGALQTIRLPSLAGRYAQSHVSDGGDDSSSEDSDSEDSDTEDRDSTVRAVTPYTPAPPPRAAAMSVARTPSVSVSASASHSHGQSATRTALVSTGSAVADRISVPAVGFQSPPRSRPRPGLSTGAGTEVPTSALPRVLSAPKRPRPSLADSTDETSSTDIDRIVPATSVASPTSAPCRSEPTLPRSHDGSDISLRLHQLERDLQQALCRAERAESERDETHRSNASLERQLKRLEMCFEGGRQPTPLSFLEGDQEQEQVETAAVAELRQARARIAELERDNQVVLEQAALVEQSYQAELSQLREQAAAGQALALSLAHALQMNEQLAADMVHVRESEGRLTAKLEQQGFEIASLAARREKAREVNKNLRRECDDLKTRLGAAEAQAARLKAEAAQQTRVTAASAGVSSVTALRTADLGARSGNQSEAAVSSSSLGLLQRKPGLPQTARGPSTSTTPAGVSNPANSPVAGVNDTGGWLLPAHGSVQTSGVEDLQLSCSSNSRPISSPTPHTNAVWSRLTPVPSSRSLGLSGETRVVDLVGDRSSQLEDAGRRDHVEPVSVNAPTSQAGVSAGQSNPGASAASPQPGLENGLQR